MFRLLFRWRNKCGLEPTLLTNIIMGPAHYPTNSPFSFCVALPQHALPLACSFSNQTHHKWTGSFVTETTRLVNCIALLVPLGGGSRIALLQQVISATTTDAKALPRPCIASVSVLASTLVKVGERSVILTLATPVPAQRLQSLEGELRAPAAPYVSRARAAAPRVRETCHSADAYEA